MVCAGGLAAGWLGQRDGTLVAEKYARGQIVGSCAYVRLRVPDMPRQPWVVITPPDASGENASGKRGSCLSQSVLPYSIYSVNILAAMNILACAVPPRPRPPTIVFFAAVGDARGAMEEVRGRVTLPTVASVGSVNP